MCGRFTLRVPLGVLVDQFAAQLTHEPEYSVRYNIAPTQQILVVRLHEGHRELTTMRWGQISSWAKDIKVGSSGINARSGGSAPTDARYKARPRVDQVTCAAGS